METPRTLYIRNFFYSNHTDDDFFRDSFFYLKLHALFNCLTPSEIWTIYFKHLLHGERFKSTLLNFIRKKSETGSIDFTLIAIELIENYTLQTYNSQIAYRTFLSQIIQSLSPKIIRDYFNLFIKSNRINDRKKAYIVAECLWKDVEQIIWDNFFEFKDEVALKQIINNTKPYTIAIQLKNIWSIDFPRNWLKKLIIGKTRKENISHFKFIKNTEPTFYIQALSVRNQPIDKKLLHSVIKEMKKRRNGFIFYYLGLAKEWNLLTESLKTIKIGYTQ